MTGTHDSLIAELEFLSGLQQRIDRVANDLVSGERKFAVIEPERLASLLGVETGGGRDWMNHRAWALRKNIQQDDSGETLDVLKAGKQRPEFRQIIDNWGPYSAYEWQVEESLCKPNRDGKTLTELLLGWYNWMSTEFYLKSTSGIVFRFIQITNDGEHFALLSPYIDGWDFSEKFHEDFHELRFAFIPYDWSTLESQSTYIFEMDCDESEIWTDQYCDPVDQQWEPQEATNQITASGAFLK